MSDRQDLWSALSALRTGQQDEEERDANQDNSIPVVPTNQVGVHFEIIMCFNGF